MKSYLYKKKNEMDDNSLNANKRNLGKSIEYTIGQIEKSKIAGKESQWQR